MKERWVVNASPIICLAKAGYIDILKGLADEILIPQGVAFEIQAGDQNDSARISIENGEFSIQSVSTHQGVQAWDLGKGETEVLSYALNNTGWTAIVDDLAARKCAASYGIPIKGTLAVIILAKKQGLIPSAAVVMHALKDAGLRVDNNVLKAVLKAVDEDL